MFPSKFLHFLFFHFSHFILPLFLSYNHPFHVLSFSFFFLSGDDSESSDSGRGSPRRKKFPARASKRSKTLAYDSSDEDEESEESDGWDSDDFLEGRPVEVEEDSTPSRSIDKLFDVREADGQFEWFLKWKGHSYGSSEV